MGPGLHECVRAPRAGARTRTGAGARITGRFFMTVISEQGTISLSRKHCLSFLPVLVEEFNFSSLLGVHFAEFTAEFL